MSISVADALTIQALPEALRRELMALVRDAFHAGWEQGVECADNDAKAPPMAWRYVPDAKHAAAWFWLDEEAGPILDVANPEDFDAIYAPTTVGRTHRKRGASDE